MRIAILLLIICIFFAIIQQSHLFVTEKVMDDKLGLAIDKTHVEWSNLTEYLQNIPEEVKKFFLKAKHPR